MAEIAATASKPAVGSRGLLPAIAWRSLWRNRRRTWLTAGGIAFGVALVMFSMALQTGSYGDMINNATSLLTGHAQVQRTDYIELSRFEQTIDDATTLVRQIEQQAGVLSVAARVEAFALVSIDERSFGAQVLGVDVERERQVVNFFDRVKRGRLMAGPDEAVIGSGLARNLNANLGDEMVILGAGKQGGVAALVLDIVGIFDSGISELDRSLVLVPIATVQNEFGLGDEVHTIVLRTQDVDDSAAIVEALTGRLPESLSVRTWDEVLPEVRQSIDVDRLGGMFMYAFVLIVVTFSIINTFIMTVFERTREFSMLKAIGMRPGKIVVMMQIEALLLWLIGVGIAMGLTVPLLLWLESTGIYLGEGITELAEGMYMSDRIFPALGLSGLLVAPAVMLVATQLAAFFSCLRIYWLRATVGLRAAE